MRALALALVLGLPVPATASAAGYGEVGLRPIAGEARCLRATGAPGELVRWAPRGAEVLQASAAGFAGSAPVALGGAPVACPSAAAQPGGAGLIAAPLEGDAIGVAWREPGGGWTPARRIALPRDSITFAVAVAVSPGGAGLIAWAEFDRGDRMTRFRVVRRPAGGAPGAPADLAPPHRFGVLPPTVAVGMDAAGGAVALWSENPQPTNFRSPAYAAIAPPGGPFGTPQQLSADAAEAPSLAVAPDGRALAVLPDGFGARVAERAPGGGFGAAVPLEGTDELGGLPVVALRPDGGALIAWSASSGDDDVVVVQRDGPGPFGPPLAVPGSSIGFVESRGPILAARRPDFVDDTGRALTAAFAGDGRAVLAWAADITRDRFAWTAAHVATPPGAPQLLGGPLRDVATITPVILAGGIPALAWGDNAPGGGHLHLAPEGAVAPAQAPFPRVRIGRPRRTVLRPEQPLILPVSCSAACDLRGFVAPDFGGGVSLPRAGRALLRIGGGGSRSIAPARPGTRRVRVLSGPPGAATVHTRSVTVRLRRAVLGKPPRGLVAVGTRVGIPSLLRGATTDGGPFAPR